MSPRGCGKKSHTPCFKILLVLHGHTFPVLEFTGIRAPHLSTDTKLSKASRADREPPCLSSTPTWLLHTRVPLPPACSQAQLHPSGPAIPEPSAHPSIAGSVSSPAAAPFVPSRSSLFHARAPQLHTPLSLPAPLLPSRVWFSRATWNFLAGTGWCPDLGP